MNNDELRQKAAKGNVVAQCVLGIRLLEGIDIAPDYSEAFRLLSAAANKGIPRAAASLARMHAEALGVPKSISEAIRLFEFAARAGEFSAQIALGRIYARGQDVPADPGAASRWYSAAVAQEQSVGECEEIREAKAFLAHPQK
jgi:TPR repeat protein